MAGWLLQLTHDLDSDRIGVPDVSLAIRVARVMPLNTHYVLPSPIRSFAIASRMSSRTNTSESPMKAL
jgi:hypothetical protein